jgi:hypothetical protein
VGERGDCFVQRSEQVRIAGFPGAFRIDPTADGKDDVLVLIHAGERLYRLADGSVPTVDRLESRPRVFSASYGRSVYS